MLSIKSVLVRYSGSNYRASLVQYKAKLNLQPVIVDSNNKKLRLSSSKCVLVF